VDLSLRASGDDRPSSSFEQLRHVVDADHRAAAPRGGEGRVAAASRDIEHPVARVDVE